ncbi:MAG TPA: spore germination protein GerW family protein [Bacteroidia bacterium]|nr:spore germination protein GerW family protein [Bacteroidia bacterium]
MKANLDETIQKLTEFLKDEVKTDTIIGKEFKLGEFSCVPVMSIGLGVGAGGGEGTAQKGDQGEGAGGGAGMGMAPIGFLVTRGEQIQFIAAKGHGALATAFEKLPDLLGKYFESKKKATATA